MVEETESNSTETLEVPLPPTESSVEKEPVDDSRFEEMEGKIEALQDSLDAALEELAMKNDPPKADPDSFFPDEVPFTPQPVSKPKPVEEKVAAETEKEISEEDDNIESEIESAINRDESFRESMLLREEARDIKDELREALRNYPEADEDEILRGIEDGEEENSSNQIELLAEHSAERIKAERSGLRKTIEDEVRAELSKESEGGTSIPQSPASPKVSSEQPGDGKFKAGTLSEESDWGSAIKQAKAEGIGD